MTEPMPKPAVVLMTEAEHRAMDLTAELWNLLCTSVSARGVTHEHDCGEMAHHIHAIQTRIMSQAAARAYPERYRLMGSTLRAAP